MYELLVFIHILGAVVWLGGGVFAQVELRKASGTGNPGDLAASVESLERVSPVVFNIFPPLTLLAGIGLVIWSDSWGFGQLWVYGALILVVGTIVLGAGMTSKALQQARSAADQGDASAVSGAVARLTRIGNLDLLILLGILALMVFKPGV